MNDFKRSESFIYLDILFLYDHFIRRYSTRINENEMNN